MITSHDFLLVVCRITKIHVSIVYNKARYGTVYGIIAKSVGRQCVFEIRRENAVRGPQGAGTKLPTFRQTSGPHCRSKIPVTCLVFELHIHFRSAQILPRLSVDNIQYFPAAAASKAAFTYEPLYSGKTRGSSARYPQFI